MQYKDTQRRQQRQIENAVFEEGICGKSAVNDWAVNCGLQIWRYGRCREISWKTKMQRRANGALLDSRVMIFRNFVENASVRQFRTRVKTLSSEYEADMWRIFCRMPIFDYFYALK